MRCAYLCQSSAPLCHMCRVVQNCIRTPYMHRILCDFLAIHTVYTPLGLARTIYIRCIYGIFVREITKYTVLFCQPYTPYIYGSGQPCDMCMLEVRNRILAAASQNRNAAAHCLKISAVVQNYDLHTHLCMCNDHYTHTHTHTRAHTHAHTLSHTHTHTHTPTHTHTHKTYTHTYTHTHEHTDTSTYTNTSTYTYTCTCTHTHTHTHTHK